MATNIQKADYPSLINDIGKLLKEGKQQAIHTVNTVLVHTYWHIGQRIVEFEQRGNEKAEYGGELLKRLSKDLRSLRFGHKKERKTR